MCVWVAYGKVWIIGLISLSQALHTISEHMKWFLWDNIFVVWLVYAAFPCELWNQLIMFYIVSVWYLISCRVKEDYMKRIAMLVTQEITNWELHQSCARYATTRKWTVCFYHVVMLRLVQAVQQDYLILVGHVIFVNKWWALFIQCTNDNIRTCSSFMIHFNPCHLIVHLIFNICKLSNNASTLWSWQFLLYLYLSEIFTVRRKILLAQQFSWDCKIYP